MTAGRNGNKLVPDKNESHTRMEWSLREFGRFPTRDELIALRTPDDLPRGLRSHGAARQDPDHIAHGRVPAGVGVDWA